VSKPRRETVIPAAFQQLFTESLLESLDQAAEGIENCGLDPECYAEPLKRFDAVRAVLDATEWGAAVWVDAATHAVALQVALADRLECERGFMSDAARHEDKVRERRANTYAREIEEFMASAGLEIPA
jgi:hypothetical protein